MKEHQRTKMIRVGDYVAEVEIELAESDEGWSPTISIEDGLVLDKVREALERGDIETAARYGRVYTLTPVKG